MEIQLFLMLKGLLLDLLLGPRLLRYLLEVFLDAIYVHLSYGLLNSDS